MSSLTHNAGKYNLFDPKTFAYLIDGDQFATLRYRLRPKASESFMKYKTTQLTSFAIDLLQSAGLPSDKAKSVAEVLVEGDLLGHTTHGLALLAPYLAEIEKGSMRTVGAPITVSDFPAALTWDGNRLPGPWLVLQAMEVAIERAKLQGTCTVPKHSSIKQWGCCTRSEISPSSLNTASTAGCGSSKPKHEAGRRATMQEMR